MMEEGEHAVTSSSPSQSPVRSLRENVYSGTTGNGEGYVRGCTIGIDGCRGGLVIAKLEVRRRLVFHSHECICGESTCDSSLSINIVEALHAQLYLQESLQEPNRMRKSVMWSAMEGHYASLSHLSPLTLP